METDLSFGVEEVETVESVTAETVTAEVVTELPVIVTYTTLSEANRVYDSVAAEETESFSSLPEAGFYQSTRIRGFKPLFWRDKISRNARKSFGLELDLINMSANNGVVIPRIFAKCDRNIIKLLKRDSIVTVQATEHKGKIYATVISIT